MVQYDVYATSMAPDFVRFVHTNQEELGLERVIVDRIIHYVKFEGKNNDKEVFRFWLSESGGKIFIVVPVDEPPTEIPSWIHSMVQQYNACLARWGAEPVNIAVVDPKNNLQVVYVYRY